MYIHTTDMAARDKASARFTKLYNRALEAARHVSFQPHKGQSSDSVIYRFLYWWDRQRQW